MQATRKGSFLVKCCHEKDLNFFSKFGNPLKIYNNAKKGAVMIKLIKNLYIYAYLTYINVGKLSPSLLYLTLVTSCIIGSFLCCHLLYLIIYLDRTDIFLFEL